MPPSDCASSYHAVINDDRFEQRRQNVLVFTIKDSRAPVFLARNEHSFATSLRLMQAYLGGAAEIPNANHGTKRGNTRGLPLLLLAAIAAPAVEWRFFRACRALVRRQYRKHLNTIMFNRA